MNPASLLAEEGFRLHLLDRVQEAEPLYRKAVLLEPGFTQAWMNLGLALLAQGRSEEALACQRTALRLDPENTDALNNLGLVLYGQGHIVEAANCFDGAVRLRPDHANATLNLGSTRQLFNRVDEAERLFRRALELGVDPARGKSNLALALLEQVRPDAAEQCCREALAERPGYPEARANLALALLTLGRLEEGWREYEARWEVEDMRAPAPVLAKPRWTGQELNGETVLLYAEQGFGDTLQFCRYASLVAAAGGRVVLVVPQALQRLMTTLEGVSEVLTDDLGVLPAFDFHCPLLSLPFAFRTTMATIPGPRWYLRGDAAGWRDFLGTLPDRKVGGTLPDRKVGGTLPGLKVGLVWAGKSRAAQPHAVAIDQRRSMRLADMAPLLAVPGCSFVSLQLGPPAIELAALPDGMLHDVSGRIGDWAETAGLISGLDLVIAVDTAVAHLAGALGKPVWLLNRFDTCWRWFLERDDSPWYPTMRQYRQRSRGDWAEVIRRVRDALTDLAASNAG